MRLLTLTLAALALAGCSTPVQDAAVVVPEAAQAEPSPSPSPSSEPVDCPPGDGGRTTGCEGPASGQYPWTAEDYDHIAAMYDEMAADATGDYPRKVYTSVAENARESAARMRRQRNAESPRPAHP